MGLFKRFRKPAAEISGLGRSLIAARLDEADSAPADSTVVVFNPAGHARRAEAGRVVRNEGDTVYCFHPGPYQVDLTPFAAAPEIGLRLRFLIDAANPRVAQQRFDLFLFSEAEAELSLSGFCAAVQGALQGELARGALDLPPCTSLDEWNEFRAGLNQLLYTRFGVTVDDCVPVDLGDTIDFADILRARAAASPAIALPVAASPVVAPPVPQVAVPPAAVTPMSAAAESFTAVAEPSAAAISHASLYAATGQAVADVAADAKALRRLFLELPVLSGALRLLVLPDGVEIFKSHQAVLRRLSLLALEVNTMPSLAWAAPDQPLESAQQSRRCAHSAAAISALDEGWALLSRLQLESPAPWAGHEDDTDRICANLEYHLSQRRAARAQVDTEDSQERKEPKL